ncbi:MAG TPA: S1C family serine protease [Fimbriimonadaceae bacterium]|jgi:S1-C subfamily serine protease
MLWLAASLILIQGGTAKIADPALNAAWSKIQHSVVIIERGPIRRGTAALIDAQGYFITGNSVLGGEQTVDGEFFDGRHITLVLVAVDAPTQLALLKTNDPVADRPVVAIFQQGEEKIDPDHPKSVVAGLPAGPIMAELVNTRALALLRSQRSISTLSEIHFEAPPTGMAGSPIFSTDGRLVGVLQATLSTVPTGPKISWNFSGPSRSQGFGGGRAYGPGGLTVAYSPGPNVLDRVIKGLMSPKHEVLRPAIGVWCRDAKRPGALVDAVLDDSPAGHAGIKEGDIIINIEGTVIKSQVDFGRTMLAQPVGTDIHISILRSGKLMNFRVKVGM